MATAADVGVAGTIKWVEVEYEGSQGLFEVTEGSTVEIPLDAWFKIKVHYRVEMIVDNFGDWLDYNLGWTYGVTLAGTGPMSLEGDPKQCGFFDRESGPLPWAERGVVFPQDGAIWRMPEGGLQVSKIKLWITPLITDIVPKHEDWFV